MCYVMNRPFLSDAKLGHYREGWILQKERAEATLTQRTVSEVSVWWSFHGLFLIIGIAQVLRLNPTQEQLGFYAAHGPKANPRMKRWIWREKLGSAP